MSANGFEPNTGVGGKDTNVFAGKQDKQKLLIRFDSPLFDAAFTPPVVDDVEHATTGEIDTSTDQTGHTENTEQGDTGVTLTVNGKMSINQYNAIDEVRRQGARLEVTSHFGAYTLFVRDMKGKIRDDVPAMEYESAEFVPVFFQFQLKSQSSRE